MISVFLKTALLHMGKLMWKTMSNHKILRYPIFRQTIFGGSDTKLWFLGGGLFFWGWDYTYNNMVQRDGNCQVGYSYIYNYIYIYSYLQYWATVEEDR